MSQNTKLTCIEKRVHFDLPHDQRISKHSKKAEKQIKVWDVNLKHRMACNKLLFLIKRLDYPRWIAVTETGFGGFLSVRKSTIPKDLATWLLISP